MGFEEDMNEWRDGVESDMDEHYGSEEVEEVAEAEEA